MQFRDVRSVWCGVSMKKVFLDSNVVISVGKPPYGPEFARVIDLVKSEQIRILTTDLTIAEVTKHHMRRDFNEIKCLCNQKFREMVKDSVDTQIPNITEQHLLAVLQKKYRRLAEKISEDMKAKLLKISDVKTNNVFSDYFDQRGLFADGKGKKHQFPDAFVFERLKDEASQNEPIIIVSRDRDFERPVNDQDHMSFVKSLPDLFNKLGLKLEAPEIESFLEQNSDALTEMVDDELSNCWLAGDIEDSEITEAEVISVNFHDTIAFESAEEGGAILVVGQCSAPTIVKFSHPDESTYMYDSEENPDINFDIVNSENEIELKIDVSLSITVDDKGNPVEIEELEFRNNNFFYIELDPNQLYW